MNKKDLEFFFANQNNLCVSGASNEQITSINIKLSEKNIPQIPDSYINFLKKNNGFNFDGLEFFGTEDITREEKRYIFPSLLSSNQDFANYEFFANKLIIGIISENFIIYNAENKNYAIIDTINLHTLEEFSSFDTLFNYLTKLCSPSI